MNDELYHAHLASDLGNIREAIGELKSEVRNLATTVTDLEKQVVGLNEQQAEYRATTKMRSKIAGTIIGIVSAAIGAGTSYVLNIFQHGASPPLH